MAHEFSRPAGEMQIGEVSPAARKVLPHPANSRFILRYHPLRWQWVDNDHAHGEWLPLLGQRVIDGGINGTENDMSQAHAAEYDRDHDWQAIPYLTTQDGESYLRARECAGGLYHYTRWETPRAVGREVVASVIDHAGYYDWLRWLIAEGHIESIGEDAKRRCAARQQQRISSLQRDARMHPHVADRLAEEQTRLAAMLGTEAKRKRRATAKEAE